MSKCACDFESIFCTATVFEAFHCYGMGCHYGRSLACWKLQWRQYGETSDFIQLLLRSFSIFSIAVGLSGMGDPMEANEAGRRERRERMNSMIGENRVN